MTRFVDPTMPMPSICISWREEDDKTSMRWTLTLVCLIFIGLCGSGWEAVMEPGRPDTLFTGPPDPKELERFLDPFFAEQMEKLHITGAVFVLVKEGEVFFAKGYGYSDLERKIPVVPDRTVFRVASVSKLFTATAVMQLHEQGLLQLDEDVNRYLKRFQLENNFPRPVTTAHLLTHTAGLDERQIGIASRNQPIPLEAYLSARMPPRVMPPGELISYSNHGYALLGDLVETISGLPFPEYIDRNIFKPLGMAQSRFLPPQRSLSDLAVGYEYKNDTYRAVPFYAINTVPASSLTATAADMARFMIAHLQKGRYGEARILREVTAEEMHRRQFTHHPKLAGMAYGFFEQIDNVRRAIYHDGGMTGFSSRLFLLPERNIGFFVSCNNHYEPEFFQELTRRFLDYYWPVQHRSTPPPPSADFQSRSGRFAGGYRSVEHARSTLEKLVTLLGELRILSNTDGTLTIRFPGDHLPSRRGVEVEPLLFQSIDGKGYAAFREDRHGNISHLFLDQLALEKLPWYETAPFQLRLIGFFGLVFLSACIAWPIPLTRRRRNAPSQIVPAWRHSHFLIGLVSTLNLIFLIGLAVALLQVDQMAFAYGMPPFMLALLSIPMLTTGLTIGLVYHTALAWKNGSGSLPGRCYYTLVTLATLMFIPFLEYWNLLGFRY